MKNRLNKDNKFLLLKYKDRDKYLVKKKKKINEKITQGDRVNTHVLVLVSNSL